MKKRERKGFTLIELLVTILIVSLVTVIGVVSVTKILDVTKENKNKISIKNIQTSARTYVQEFDKNWLPFEEDNETEYTCTTVGMLINKGFLKENLIGTDLDVKVKENGVYETKEITIQKNTSIIVKRNIDTKVLTSEDLNFDSEVCNNLSNVNINFSVYGTKGDNNWYITDVVVIPKITGNIHSDFEPVYTLKVGDTESNNGYVVGIDKSITISKEERNIDFCMTVMDKNTDQEKIFCLSDENEKIFMDKTSPEISEEDFKLDSNYNLIANNAHDNITSSDNIKYYLTYDNETESTGSVSFTIDEDVRAIDKEVKVYVKDEAGNISEIVTKTLNIEDAKNGNVTSITKYYCSLNGNEYSSNNEASADCTGRENGVVTPKKTYYCSLNNNEYTSSSEASADCRKTENGTVTSNTTYYCSLNDNEYTSSSQASSECTSTTTGTVTNSTKYYCSLNNNEYTSSSQASADCTSTTTGTVTSDKVYYCSLNDNEYSSSSAASADCTEQGDYEIEYSCDSGTLSGTKCYTYTSATKKTMYGLTCAAGTTTTYGWSSTGTTSGLTSCSSSSASCSKSSHVGNTKTSCSSYEEHTKTYSTDDECAKYAPSDCSCDVHDGKGYYVMCPRYKKTTYTCKATTSTSSTKTYTGKSGSGTTSGGCPSGTTATLDDSESTCSGYIGDSCSSSCSSCCGDYKYYTCSSSTSADKEYYCEENGRTYSSASSCKKTGTVTSDTSYYCDLNGKTYTSLTTANNNCKTTTTGNVTSSTKYYCSLNSNTYTSNSAATTACTSTTTGSVTSDTEYYCDLNGQTYTSESTANSNCKNVTTGTVSDKTEYICNLNSNTYFDQTSASNSCYKIINGNVTSNTKYYCDLDNSNSYNSESTANNSCTNQCSSGYSLNNRNNACYKLS